MKNHNSIPSYTRKQSGFTLIEVLVSIVVISIGLLGVASMQFIGLRDSNRSSERSQATILAYDIADRMRMNARGAHLGLYQVDPDNPPAVPAVGSGNSPQSFCITDFTGTAIANFCSAANLAAADTYDWHTTIGNTLPAGLGEITCTDADGTDADPCSPGSVHLITVMWNEQREDVSGTNCSGNLLVDRLCISVDVQL